MKKIYHRYAIVTRKGRNYSIIESSFTAAIGVLIAQGISEQKIHTIERRELYLPK